MINAVYYAAATVIAAAIVAAGALGIAWCTAYVIKLGVEKGLWRDFR